MANETFFVDTGLGNDSNDGLTAGTAFKTLQKGIDSWTGGGGNEIRITGTDLLSATVTQIKPGDTTDGFNKIIGMNSSFVNDGTKAVLDGQSGIGNVLSQNGALQWFENLTLKDATGIGFTAAGASLNCVYINIESLSHGSDGWDMLNRNDESLLLQCRSNNNSGHGFDRLQRCAFITCEAIGNSSSGFNGLDDPKIIGCVAHNNTLTGFNATTGFGLAIHGVSDGNDIGMDASVSNFIIALWNRITNNTTDGLKIAAAKTMLEDRNFFLGNGTKFNNSGILESLGNSLDTGTEGYENKAGDDFDLLASATLRESSIGVGSI